MKSKSTVLTAIVAAAALALSACGSSDEATPTSTSTSAAAAGTDESSAESPADETSAEESADDTADSDASSAGSSSAGSSAATSVEGQGTDTSPIKIGSAGFSESILLGEIYALALEAKGVQVERNLSIGSREVYLPALEDGGLDLLPEYSGTLLQHYDPATEAASSEEVYAALPAALPDGFIVLEQSAAEDKDTITVTQETADKYSLKSIADLAPVAGELTFGGPSEIETRPSGLPGFEAKYGVVFGTFLTLDAGGPLTVDALDTGTIDAGDMFTTDPTIGQKGWVILEDPENVFTAQNVLPLINAKKATPEVVDALNGVSDKLTTQVLLDLLTKVYAGESEADVAKAWVTEVGLG